jgi:uncharacterized protein YjlB
LDLFYKVRVMINKQQRIETNPDIMTVNLRPNKNFPNSALPVLIYKNACLLPEQKNKAAEIIRGVFLKNSWSNSWKNGIYNFHHYHSTTHECMGVCAGKAKIILGGPNGRRVELVKGDIIIIPAGVAHKCSNCSKDFLCVGAYPQGKDYDINIGKPAEYKKAVAHTSKLGLPRRDPLYGKQGFLASFWK